jgi:hypothetical protein
MDTEFTTTSGYTIKLKAVSPLLIQKVTALLHDPKPPVYTVKGLGGEEIAFEHDETSIQDPATSAVERLQWKEYQKQLREIEAQRRSKLIDIMFARGIVFDLPDTDWEQEHEFLGLTVPTNPIEKKVHFLQTEVFTSAADITEVIALLMQMTSGLSETEMDAIRATFRRSVQGTAAEGVAAAAVENGRPEPTAADGVDVLDTLS